MSEYRLEMRDVVKTFPGVKALDHAQLKLRPGTVHALMGENGAGKSTLMKCMFGIYKMDEGQIVYEGEPIQIKDPLDALNHGIAMVHQELQPIPERSVAENIFVGRYPIKKLLGFYPIIDHKKMYEDTAKLLEEVRMPFDPRAKLGTLSVSQMQLVEIAKAVSANCKVLILDEPTSSLTENEVEALFRIVDDLRAKGVSIVYISHKMDEILRISDEVTIMRDGQWVATRPAKELILTPHPGEMSRLTGLSVEAVQADREGVARRYAAQWNAVVVLKGARTVVAAPDGRVCVNPTGNPGLARGGSGDVLAGMTSALLACGLSACEAAACAVWLHGAAADRAARQKGEYGMLPQDIFAHLGQMFAENDR